MLQIDLEGVTKKQSSYRAKIVKSLAVFRREWQEISEGESLIEINAPVGLILGDIADQLGLSSQERHVMLGGKLVKQINAFREERPNIKLPS